MLLATLLVVLPVVVILGIIVAKGASAISWEFLSDAPRGDARRHLPGHPGDALPGGGGDHLRGASRVLSAIYLIEYSSENCSTRLIKLAIVNLAGVPSVVYGLFGLALFVTFFKFGASILSGSLTLGIMILPVIITTAPWKPWRACRSLSAKPAVPWAPASGRRSDSVLPNAISGILTGTILGLGRAAGETAPILFTVAAFYLPRLPVPSSTRLWRCLITFT